MPRKLPLAHVPTPLFRHDALDRLVGTALWIKRDDMTAGAEAGNKIRKLEYLLGDALERGATTVITCGGVQSNHARATALCCARFGLRSLLLLRTPQPDEPQTVHGNLLLDRLAGAEVRFILPAQYQNRSELMSDVQRELDEQGQNAYVIPEGGSDGLGALGYVDAMQEVRAQLDLGLGGGPTPFDAVAHACGSGGTAAGVVLGAARWSVAKQVYAMAVCDDRAYFESRIGAIVAHARTLDHSLSSTAELSVFDSWKGPGYGVASAEQLAFIREVASTTGLVLDPVYTGKALFALSRLTPKPARVLFIHTGGLPGLLAEAAAFGDVLRS
ncbi:MAG TPA: D-cysteine desulfhydrase family protein [Polyangiaceae bacterium]